jgi:polyhydroxybutyrate depolymerase
VLSVDESVALWRRVNRATSPGEPRVEELPDSDPDDKSRVVRIAWAPAEGGAPVVLYRIEGGGHTEPSRAERYGRLATTLLGPQNGDVESAEEIWSFFTRISTK